MSVLLNKQRYRRDGSVEKFRNFRKFPRRSVACFLSLEYSQSNKELAYLKREGYLQEELLSEDIQVCAGHSEAAETAIHTMSQVFDEEETDGILLIDATNAFNQMNRAVAMHSVQITCPIMSKYVINTYRSPSRLFVCGGGRYYSGWPTSYALVLFQHVYHDTKPEIARTWS